MKIKRFLINSCMLLILVLVILVNGCGNKRYDDFAKCLSEKNAVMYGADWCEYCKEQKRLFGSSFRYIPYVNCDFNKEECEKNDIKGYPTWVINGEAYGGVQQLSRLSYLTGCELY